MNVPDLPDWRDLEKLVQQRLKYLNRDKVLHMVRYGKDSRWDPNSKQLVQIPSKPDFGGAVYPTGRAIDVDTKVVSGASFKILNKDHVPKVQIEHLMARSKVGALAYFLVHFNSRTLKTRVDPAVTVAVDFHSPGLVEAIEAGELKSIHRDQVLNWGFEVLWNCYGNMRTLTPAVESLVHRDHVYADPTVDVSDIEISPPDPMPAETMENGKPVPF